MRSNGLTAATYTPVADLNPQFADALLADLKERGVAAYTKPVESSTAAGFDRPEYRDGVKDRLYVDTAASDDVREVLAAHDPELVDRNDDLAWEQIVAGFDRQSVADVNPWPENENLGSDEELVDERDKAPSDDRLDAEPKLRWGMRNARDDNIDDDDFLAATRGRAEVGDDEVEPADRFVPPEPPPLPRLQPYQIAAWVGVLGGPALLLLAALFSYTLPSLLLAAAILGFIGGFVTLVATMGNGGDDDWKPGNGAVV